ncbi:hypothetical protein POM88_045149 [Heracleum sosnowskyi]|uniref:Uncharacterized protein n=1 Tax=Heracleum sosnowskyi TaxID=360622 RepID=A0AAD8M3I8_9APIA|nr:hypothetical protein POM88_045149 [Heracleum sosnowskyi]
MQIGCHLSRRTRRKLVWLDFLVLIFQPLGGDWREPVKRKRARLLKKSVEDLSENITNGNQQPDLDKIQRDLPSGWQKRFCLSLRCDITLTSKHVTRWLGA